MVAMIEMNRIKRLSRRIAREFRPDRIVLFGSYAYGKPRGDSDVDLMVVMRFKGHPMRKALEIIERVNPAFSVDLLVRRPDEVKERIDNNDWFLREVFERGQILYEATDAGMGR
jgi:uncharacterized protein